MIIYFSIVFSIVQGADWHYGPTKQSNFYIYPNSGQPGYIKYSSLAAFILALVFLFANLLFQARKQSNIIQTVVIPILGNYSFFIGFV